MRLQTDWRALLCCAVLCCAVLCCAVQHDFTYSSAVTSSYPPRAPPKNPHQKLPRSPSAGLVSQG
eukprot:1596093-Rhodomonas_salina.2